MKEVSSNSGLPSDYFREPALQLELSLQEHSYWQAVYNGPLSELTFPHQIEIPHRNHTQVIILK